MADAVTVTEVEEPKDFGTDEAAVATRWISELDLSEKSQVKWIERGKKINALYREEGMSAGDTKKRRFALLWANIETLAPAIYARTPTAVVGRRYKDEDAAGRYASETLERALNYAIETQDFADVMTGLRNEFLLVARGQAWIRYEAETEDKPSLRADAAEGETYPDVTWERCLVDHVNWQDFGTNPARTWAEVRFVWRAAFMTREQLKDRFGDKGSRCPLDWAERNSDGSPVDDQFSKAKVYEIWDKDSQQRIFICRGFTEGPLEAGEVPFKLEGFFPCPRPLLGTCGPESTIPVPDYIYYQTQAEEINDLTYRIDTITDALKVVGFYDARHKGDLATLFSSSTNTMVPVEGYAVLKDAGGMKGIIEWFPIDVVVAALEALIKARKQLLDDVFQITGIADIMRGDTDPDETASAQKLKATWGSSRVRDKQKEMGRFARDVLRIMGEVIATKFSQQTLAKMTNVQLMTEAEKAQVQHVQQLQQQQAALAAQAQAQQPQTPGAPPPPPAPAPTPVPPQVQTMMGLPSWEDVMAVLQDNALRSFRIDVETDSTIEPNDQEEKARRVEFVGAVGKFLAESLPVVQAAPQMLPVIIEGLKFVVRGFRVGREMEDVIDKALDQLQQAAQAPKPPPQDPNAQANMLKAQAAQTMAQAKMHDVQTSAQVEMAKVQMQGQIAAQQAQAENTRTQADAAALAHGQRMDVVQHGLAVQDQNHGQMMDAHQMALQTVEQAQQRELRREILDHSPAKVPTP